VTEQSGIAAFQLLFYAALGFGLPSDLFALAFSLPHSRCRRLCIHCALGMSVARLTLGSRLTVRQGRWCRLCMQQYAACTHNSSLMPALHGCRKQELEADRVGMDLAARACFDPAAGKHVRF
jgi:hypothetical protein